MFRTGLFLDEDTPQREVRSKRSGGGSHDLERRIFIKYDERAGIAAPKVGVNASGQKFEYDEVLQISSDDLTSGFDLASGRLGSEKRLQVMADFCFDRNWPVNGVKEKKPTPPPPRRPEYRW